MSCFNDDAKMRVFIGAGTMTWVSKEELRERLEDGLWDRYRWESNSFKNPKITVNGSQATVKGNIPGSGNWVAKHTVELNKEDNQWGITKWDCRW